MTTATHTPGEETSMWAERSLAAEKERDRLRSERQELIVALEKLLNVTERQVRFWPETEQARALLERMKP